MSAVSELGKLKTAKETGKKQNKAAYLFLAPWFVGLVLITIGPMVASFGLSFTRYNLLSPPKWIGLQNYIRMWEDERLHSALQVTFTYVFVSLPVQLAVALFLAVVLDRGLRGLAFYRSAFYLPSLLGASVAIAILWRQIFGIDGLVNQVLHVFGIQGQGWISNPDTALGTLMILNVWTFGSPMVIFLAGLRQIPTMYYEAAAVDGASRRPAALPDHDPAAHPDHLLQRRAAADRDLPVLHPGVHRLGRHRRTGRLDALLHAVPVSAGLHELQHGLRLRDGLAPARDHRRPDRPDVLDLEVLGFLR